jgi:hypothetical protein
MYWKLENLESTAVVTYSNINLPGNTANIFHDIEFVAEIRTARLPSISRKLYSCTDCSLSWIDHDIDCPKVFMVFFGPSRQMSEYYLISGRDRFLLHPFQSTIYNHPNHRRYKI